MLSALALLYRACARDETRGSAFHDAEARFGRIVRAESGGVLPGGTDRPNLCHPMSPLGAMSPPSQGIGTHFRSVRIVIHMHP